MPRQKLKPVILLILIQLLGSSAYAQSIQKEGPKPTAHDTLFTTFDTVEAYFQARVKKKLFKIDTVKKKTSLTINFLSRKNVRLKSIVSVLDSNGCQRRQETTYYNDYDLPSYMVFYTHECDGPSLDFIFHVRYEYDQEKDLICWVDDSELGGYQYSYDTDETGAKRVKRKRIKQTDFWK